MGFDLSSIGAPLDERYPSELAAQAVAAMQAALPGWIPRNASPEVVLIEAMALAVADVTNAANATIGAIEQDLLSNFFQVPRSAGTPAVGELTVTFDTTVTTTIPAGTGFSLVDYGMEVQTTAAVDVVADTDAVLQVATVEPTTLVNGVGAEASVDTLDVIPNLLTVAVSSAFANGSDVEGDAAYTLRARNRLARITNSLVVADHFSAYVLEDGRATNAATLGAWDGDSLTTLGDDTGHVTVVTYGHAANLSTTVRDELAAAMQAITAEGVTVHVNAAGVQTVAVTASVVAAPGWTAAETQAAAVAAVQAFLAPETWEIGAAVVPGAVSAAISDTPQVDYVDTLTLPSGTVTLDEDEVAKYGTITVSVI